MVDGVVTGTIKNGLVAYVGFTHQDNEKDVIFLTKKLINLRIFDDENNVMNRSIKDYGYSVLSISQFTLYANTMKGNRPSYTQAMKPQEAKMLYDRFNQELLQHGVQVETGIFGSHMIIEQINDGPVTIELQSKRSKNV